MSFIGDKLSQDEYEISRPHPIGRPPKLTVLLIEQICDLLISGHSIARSAMISGVSESTIYRWLSIGKKSGADEIYTQLVERVWEAIECSEFELLQSMRMAASEKENWRVSAWLLERRFPEKYGKRTESESTKAVNGSENAERQTLKAVQSS